MTLRGERFELELDSDEEKKAPAVDLFNFVSDIQEHEPDTIAPKPPTPRNVSSGFPSHRKRVTQSRFKKERSTGSAGRDNVPDNLTAGVKDETKGPKDGEDFMQSERRRIDEENRNTLANMSEEEIERERQELMDSLDPSLVQRLLRRANIDEAEEAQDFPTLAGDQKESASTKTPKSGKKVAFADDLKSDESEESLPAKQEASIQGLTGNDESGPAGDVPPDQAQATQIAGQHLAEANIHWPRAPQPPELDPSSPSFLTDLHQKYFPSLPSEPEKLEWMTPTPPKDSYTSSTSGLDGKDIRFNFSGVLIPPKLAAEIPVTLGLHHHGNSPDAAGYTIPELAMLARSSVPAQRCIAFQTLGRILYRLGKGEFGDPGDGLQGTVGAEDTMGALARALWREVENEGVIEVCIAESEGNGVAGGRHQSAKAYATEAVWLWQRGGGRRMKAQ